MSKQLCSPRAEDIFDMMDSKGTGTINLADFKKAFPQLMQHLSPNKVTTFVPDDDPLYPSLPDNSAEDIFVSAFNDIDNDSSVIYVPGQGVSFDEQERKGLLCLLVANAPGLPAQSAQELSREPSVPVVVETTRASLPPRTSSSAVAAVADIGAREIFAQSFGMEQEGLEESLLKATDDYPHWAPVSAADLCKKRHSPRGKTRSRRKSKLRRHSAELNPIFGSPTNIQKPRNDSEMKTLMQQHKAADKKRWEMIDSIRTQVSPNSSHAASAFF